MTTTQLQRRRPKLIHAQTHAFIELPPNLSVIHIGKPNGRIAPDIDLSSLPNADVVSRVHAKISVDEERYYFIEDLQSSNGTYLNGTRLTPQTRRMLKLNDRIDFGTDENITLIFSE